MRCDVVLRKLNIYFRSSTAYVCTLACRGSDRREECIANKTNKTNEIMKKKERESTKWSERVTAAFTENDGIYIYMCVSYIFWKAVSV